MNHPKIKGEFQYILTCFSLKTSALIFQEVLPHLTPDDVTRLFNDPIPAFSYAVKKKHINLIKIHTNRKLNKKLNRVSKCFYIECILTKGQT